MTSHSPALYDELADWYPLLTAPEDYGEEWAELRALLLLHAGHLPSTALELGSGAGHLAFHYSREIPRCLLVDPAPRMLELSRRLNPACRYMEGDMRRLRIGERFDLVLIHDAIMYMTSEADLSAAIGVAAYHCRPGGLVALAPDCTRESFAPGAEYGGRDGSGRALRYVEWRADGDPADDRYETDFVLLLREGDAPPRIRQERHVMGLFPIATWRRLIEQAGLELLRDGSEAGRADAPLFMARRRPGREA